MTIEISWVIDGEDCTVHARGWFSDPSVGIPFGFEECWATRDSDGTEVSIPVADDVPISEALHEAYHARMEEP